MALLFNKHPGCQEDYLRRCYHNSLLEPEKPISQDDVNAAHQADLKELAQFKERFNELLNDATQLKPNTESDVILKLKEDLDKLYEQCAGLTGDTSAYKKGISKLVVVVMQAVHQGASDDPVASSELEQEGTARAMHYALLEFPLVSHLLRTDSPIQPEQLPALLLGEDEDTVSAILSILEPALINDLYHRSEQLMANQTENIPGAPFAANILQLIKRHTEQTTRH